MPNSQTTHNCAAPGCQAVLGRHLLMCQWHWRQVPVREQRAVNRTWRDLQADRRSRDGLKHYRTAVQAAINAIATKDHT